MVMSQQTAQSRNRLSAKINQSLRHLSVLGAVTRSHPFIHLKQQILARQRRNQKVLVVYGRSATLHLSNRLLCVAVKLIERPLLTLGVSQRLARPLFAVADAALEKLVLHLSEYLRSAGKLVEESCHRGR